MNDSINPKEVCRVCLINKTESGKMLNLFSTIYDSMKVSNVIMECAPIKIKKNDDYSELICEHCYCNLQNTYKFRKLCIESDQILKNYKQKLMIKEDVISSGNAKKESIDFKIKVEDYSTSNDDELQKIENNFNVSNFSSINNYELKRKKIEKKKIKRKKLCTENENSYENDQEIKNNDTKPESNCNECKFCRKMYSTKYSLKMHYENKHNKEWEEIKQNWVRNKTGKKDNILPDPVTGRFLCDICEKGFKVKKSFQDHLKMHSGVLFNCDLCDMQFRLKNSLQSHKRVVHFGKKYTCEFCGKVFAPGGSYATHRRKHLNIKNFKCEYCHKEFSRATKLRFHIKRHTGERPFICEICGKSFIQQDNLKQHQKNVHSQENRFECDICGKILTSKHNLEYHKEKNICKDELIKADPDTGRFHCKMCEHDFRDRYTLKRHRAMVHENICYDCLICGKKYKRKEILSKHLKDIHHIEKIFICRVCNEKFEKKSALKQHKQIKHAKIKNDFLVVNSNSAINF